MSGLIDTTTGVSFGTGLQFQSPIGGAGLDVTPPVPSQTIYDRTSNLPIIDRSGAYVVNR